MKDLFQFRCSALPETARLVAFRGREALCRPYEIEVFVMLVDDADFDMADAVGSKATLIADRGDGAAPLFLHGVLSTIQHLYEVDGSALYRAVVVPRLWQLGQTRHSRVFTQQTLPQIVQAVLDEGGLAPDEYELRLDRSYEVEEHVCQYKESDLDFLHRWLEVEGLYYFFEHRDDHEVLVVTDHHAFHDAMVDVPVRYHPLTGDDRSAGECFDGFTCQHVAVPERVHVRDYDYAKPTLDVVGAATVCPTGAGEVVVHGARAFTPARSARLAEVRAEELRAGQVVFQATGTALRVRSGYTFQLEDHGRAAFNTRYLATEVSHFGNQTVTSPEIRKLVGAAYDDVYRVEVRAIRADTQFRPRQATPWPRVHGLEGAVVDGEADTDYAQIDDQGRYRVKLHLDESDLRGGKASTYVRMIQPHGGTVEGWHFPLRKGTEVVIAFLGGDPDRPVITGVAPNARTPSPVTALNHTTNVIQTGGGNRIELEDLEGSQRVTISSPHKNSFYRLGAPNDDSTIVENTDGPKKLFVGENLTIDVRGSTLEDIDNDYVTKVGALRHEECAHHYESVRSGEESYIAGGRYTEVRGGDELNADHLTIRTGPIEVHAGSVSEDFGAVQQKFKSLNTFIEGGATVTSPAGYTIIAPASHSKFTAYSSEMSGARVMVSGMRTSVFGLEVKAVHTVVVGYGIKADVGALKIDQCLVYVKNSPNVVETAGKSLRQIALEISSGTKVMV